jgi:hypothetical protein
MQREIQVIANSQNKNEVYMSNAETLGELKAELINKGYEVEDMDIKEGKSRTDLRDELTPLPSNFNYKGVETNDLVIMITPRNTKIKSGMYTRQELYAKVKEYNLQSKCVEELGKNFTQCKTGDLAAMVADVESEQQSPSNSPSVSREEIREIVNEELDKREGDYSISSIAMCFLKFVNFLEGLKIGEYHLVSKAVCDNLRKSVRKDYAPYTQEELDEMSN